MKARIGLIGCGNISEMYLSNAPLFEDFEFVACADLNLDVARAKAARHGLLACSTEDLLAREDVDIVLNLTIPAAHFDISARALDAGKHVYTEKPLSARLGDAARLVEKAAGTGLVLGCAPDTVLGPGVQTARAMIDQGKIGAPIGGTAFFQSHGVEDWHPSPAFFYQPGGGPVLDMGPYYIAALHMLLGPVREVRATGRVGRKTRIVTAEGPMQGQRIPVETLTHVNALLSYECGAEVVFVASWEARHHDLPHIEIHGTEGSVQVPDPNYFGGVVRLASEPMAWSETATSGMAFGAPHGWPDYPEIADYRGLGLADMARAIAAGRAPLCSGEVGLHILSVLDAILRSADSGRSEMVGNPTKRPDPYGTAHLPLQPA